jgi:hypothetical protein
MTYRGAHGTRKNRQNPILTQALYTVLHGAKADDVIPVFSGSRRFAVIFGRDSISTKHSFNDTTQPEKDRNP